MKTFLFQVSIIFLLSGCAAERSCSLGVRYLEEQNYDEAIQYFEEAIRSEPDNNQNYDNLACAYAAKGEIEHAWCASRQAVRTPPFDTNILENLLRIYGEYQKLYHFKDGGMTASEAKKILGEPDEVLRYGNHTVAYIYGVVVLKFRDDLMLPDDGQNYAVPPYARSADRDLS